jgi:hypothetical protein
VTALSDKLAQKAVQIVARFGAAGTLVSVVATYATGGVVTEVETLVPVILAGPVNEIEQYASSGTDTRFTGTFYISASGLTVVPKNADRVLFGDRTFAVTTVSRLSVHGVAVAYQLDVGEIGDV